jgi:hypothetical protein
VTPAQTEVVTEVGRGMIEQLPGYALVLAVLIPLIRTTISGQGRLQASRDQMLETMLQSLIASTRSLESAVDNFKMFEQNEATRHARMDASLERLAVVLDQILQLVKR